MTKREVLKEFLTKAVAPVALITLVFLMIKGSFVTPNGFDYFGAWIACGVPFGIHRTGVWLFSSDVMGFIVSIFLSIFIGGLVGGFVIIWKLIVAVWYTILTVIRVINIYRSGQIDVVG